MSYVNWVLAATAAFAVMAGAAAAAVPSARFAGEQFAAQAHITMAEAERAALKARPGVISDRELEKERGGSGLRYSFDVKSGGKVYEVGIDAKTGKVLENDVEGAHPD